MRKFAIAAIASCLVVSTSANLHCVDKNGQPTSWFANIKFPRSIRKAGDKYAYLHPKGGNAFQVVQGINIDGPQEALSRTITLINSMPKASKEQVLFNDEKPGEDAKSSGAHAKGVLAYDPKTKTGVYIMHSLPGYPKISDAGVIDPKVDEDNDKFAQHVFCLSLNEASYQAVANNLAVENPNIYFGTGIYEKFPKRTVEESKVTKIQGGAGEKIVMFTKAPRFAGLLFEDIIIPAIDAPLAVESWGRPYQKPSCFLKKNSVNINQLQFATKDTWSHGNDHSKWAVTSAKLKVACFCDMNRMESQAKRGGSCFCIEDANVHQALSSLIVDTDKCDKLTL
jgi:hypothetical protein